VDTGVLTKSAVIVKGFTLLFSDWQASFSTNFFKKGKSFTATVMLDWKVTFFGCFMLIQFAMPKQQQTAFKKNSFLASSFVHLYQIKM